jgi:hypothetical protein
MAPMKLMTEVNPHPVPANPERGFSSQTQGVRKEDDFNRD